MIFLVISTINTFLCFERDDFNFKIVNFLFLDGDVPRSLPMVYTFRNLSVLLEFVLMSMT